MPKASPFLFERDFRHPHEAPEPKHGAEIRAAEERGFARGAVEGRRGAEAAMEARLATALEGVGAAVQELLAGNDAYKAEIEADAVAFAIALGRKLAGEALEAHPLAPIAQAAAAALQHLRGVPHLVVRVHESTLEPVETMMRRLATERGFEGRLVVLGEPDLGCHDVRLEWADGAVVRDGARIEAAALDALAHARLSAPTARMPADAE